MKWIVTQEWRYHIKVEVEADSEEEAKDLADNMEGNRLYDDTLYDAEVREAGD